ncbi:MAG TPA: transglycosylase domain-containing protein [Rhodoblastus sp.]|nr:transglycosylase domain-containing protein [Rhodoblastus sp.]
MARFLGRVWRLGLAVALTAAIMLAALTALWRFAPPVSTLMLARYLTGRPVVRDYVPLERIAPALVASVVMSEDAKFCRHHGVDWQALGDVLDDADEDGPSRGASTITMQVVKNLFLWPSRSAIRKGMEIPMAMALDFAWPKRRIMEVYLNIAEWGPDGIFGAQAAAEADFRRNANALTPMQAALLATALPNPILRSPARPKPGHARLARRVAGRAEGAAPWLDCLRN